MICPAIYPILKHRAMWPFSKKWSPPDPRLAMVLSLQRPELPSLVMLANPAGADGARGGHGRARRG